MIHELKIRSTYFDDVLDGKKTFEFRLNDRDYQVGDYLALNEVTPEGNDIAGYEYTGRSCLVYVDYVLDLSPWDKDGYVIMSIKPCNVIKTQTERYDLREAPDCWNTVPCLFGMPGKPGERGESNAETTAD